jgi:hypothetical protein
MPTRRKPTKTLHPKPREKKVRLRVAPQLTRAETRQFRERAAADMRSIGSYVAKLIIERWRREYNTFRPHSSLGYRPPAPETVQWPPWPRDEKLLVALA